MKFTDLIFEKCEDNQFRSVGKVNGYRLSVTAGEMMYCDPQEDLDDVEGYNNFEVAELDDNGFATRKFVPGLDDDVLAYVSRDEINDIINAIETGVPLTITEEDTMNDSWEDWGNE